MFKIRYFTIFILINISISGLIPKANSQAQSATVQIDFNNRPISKVSKYLFGGFIEYYMAFQNGQHGLWSQEFENRGFDIKAPTNEVSLFWSRWTAPGTTEATWDTKKGGFNENGLYYERLIHNSQIGSIGIYQIIYTTKEAGYDFFIFAKTENSPANLRLKVMSPDLQTTLFDTTLGRVDTSWKKYLMTIPKIIGYNQLAITTYFNDSATVDLDEASIMPSNNVKGIRKSLYDLYKDWQPSILRYPGGWFVEYSGYHWIMGVGDKDKRSVYYRYENIHLDFGLDEYIEFCKDLGIEPHIVVNFTSGSPTEAASIVEYCNGDTNTFWGHMRAKNGHIQKYNVKYWEIGNEIWDIPYKYSVGYINFYDSMKTVDPTITCIMSGNIWGGNNFIDTLIGIVGNKCDIYGWHWEQPGKTRIPDNKTVYLSMVGGSNYTESAINLVDSLGKIFNQKINQAITEIWSEYNPDTIEWDYDTTKLAGSLENALWMASQYNALIRNGDKVSICEKTNSVGLIRHYIDSVTKERIYYPTPLYYACVMMRHHTGDSLLYINVSCNTFSTQNYDTLFLINDAPILDVVATSSTDSIYISIINKDPNQVINTTFNFPDYLIGKNAVIYELYSADYLDAHTPYDYNKITINTFNWKCENNYIFKPHSFSIIALPKTKKDSNINFAEVSDKIVISNDQNTVNITLLPNEFFNKISVYDLNGRLLDNYNYNNLNQTILDVSKYETGLYIIEISKLQSYGLNKYIKLLKL